MSQTLPAHSVVADDLATRAFSRSMLLSATRCLLTYVVFPWLIPLVGFASGVGPAIGLPIGLVAIASNVACIRRFRRSDHRWKWPVTVACSGVMVLLCVLVVQDIADLLA